MGVSLPEVTAQAEDGTTHSIKPFAWSLKKVEEYAPRFIKAGVFSDDIPKDAMGFMRYVLGSGTLWFEVVNEATQENVGFMYLSDLLPSWHENRYIHAYCHAIVWNSRVATLRPLGRDFIKEAFRWFRLHKLYMAIPAKFGGAIRNAKLLGFTDEARLREVRRYNGVWFDVILLSILEREVAKWETPLAQAYSGHHAPA